MPFMPCERDSAIGGRSLRASEVAWAAIVDRRGGAAAAAAAVSGSGLDGGGGGSRPATGAAGARRRHPPRRSALVSMVSDHGAHGQLGALLPPAIVRRPDSLGRDLEP